MKRRLVIPTLQLQISLWHPYIKSIPRFLPSCNPTFFMRRKLTTMTTHLTPGLHTFTTPTQPSFTLSYTISTPANPSNPEDLIVVSPPAWGLPPSYLSGLAPLTSSGHTLLLFHHRGTPLSTLPAYNPDDEPEQEESIMSPFTLATDLEHLRTHLGLSHLPTLLGHSNGGTIALCYAELFPNRLRNLVLLDHRLLGVNDSSNFLRFYHARHGDARYEDAYRAYFTKRDVEDDDEKFAAWWKRILPLYFFAPERHVPGFVELLGEKLFNARCSRHVDIANKSPYVQCMVRERLNDVSARTLMLFGREDAQCSVINAEETKKGIPHAETVILDECGHFPWIEQPEQTFGAIEQFLRGG